MIATVRVATLVLVLVCASPALAASLPADCSKGPVPPGPAQGEIAHKTFVPETITLRSSGYMKIGEEKFDSYMLKFSKPESGFDEMLIDMTFLVSAGVKPDGRRFRSTPGGISVQPMAAEGLPEVQGWSVEDEEADVRMSSVFSELSSLQVTLGQRKDNTISGTIYLCTPSDGTAWIGGSFTAEIRE